MLEHRERECSRCFDVGEVGRVLENHQPRVGDPVDERGPSSGVVAGFIAARRLRPVFNLGGSRLVGRSPREPDPTGPAHCDLVPTLGPGNADTA